MTSVFLQRENIAEVVSRLFLSSANLRKAERAAEHQAGGEDESYMQVRKMQLPYCTTEYTQLLALVDYF